MHIKKKKNQHKKNCSQFKFHFLLEVRPFYSTLVVYGGSINGCDGSCKCPLENLVYTCNRNAGSNGICEFQSSGIPLIIILAIFLFLIIYSVWFCFGLCQRTNGHKEIKKMQQIKEPMNDDAIITRDVRTSPLDFILAKAFRSFSKEGETAKAANSRKTSSVTFTTQRAASEVLKDDYVDTSLVLDCPYGLHTARGDAFIKLECLTSWELNTIITILCVVFIICFGIILAPETATYTNTKTKLVECPNSNSRLDCFVRKSGGLIEWQTTTQSSSGGFAWVSMLFSNMDVVRDGSMRINALPTISKTQQFEVYMNFSLEIEKIDVADSKYLALVVPTTAMQTTAVCQCKDNSRDLKMHKEEDALIQDYKDSGYRKLIEKCSTLSCKDAYAVTVALLNPLGVSLLNEDHELRISINFDGRKYKVGNMRTQYSNPRTNLSTLLLKFLCVISWVLLIGYVYALFVSNPVGSKSAKNKSSNELKNIDEKSRNDPKLRTPFCLSKSLAMKEQAWILLFFTSMFLVLNPIYFSLFWQTSPDIVLLYAALFFRNVGFAGLLLSPLLLIDGLRFNTINPGKTKLKSNFLSSHFYTWKILCTLLLIIMYSAFDLEFYRLNYTFNVKKSIADHLKERFITADAIENSSFVVGVNLALRIAVEACFALFLLWIAYSIYRTGHYLIYQCIIVSSRYRHLVFGLSLYIIPCMMVITIAYVFIFRKTLVTTHTTAVVSYSPSSSLYLSSHVAWVFFIITSISIYGYIFLPYGSEVKDLTIAFRYQDESHQRHNDIIVDIQEEDNESNNYDSISSNCTSNVSHISRWPSLYSFSTEEVVDSSVSAKKENNSRVSLFDGILKSKKLEVEALFCLETASMLFNASRLVYQNISRSETTSCGSFHNSFREFDFFDQIDDTSTSTRVLLYHNLNFVAQEISGQQYKQNYAQKKVKLFISFRGTHDFSNVATDFRIKQVPYTIGKSDNILEQVMVHKGFLKAFESIEHRLHSRIEDFQALINTNPSLRSTKLDIEYYVTGHSLGGALCTIAAYNLSFVLEDLNCKENSICVPPLSNPKHSYDLIAYTFGSPRVGNSSFCSLYDKRIPSTYRIVTNGDIIAGIPKHSLCLPCLHRYYHVGKLVIIDPSGNGRFILQPTLVEKFLLTKRYRKMLTHQMSSYKNAILGILYRGLSGGDVWHNALMEAGEDHEDTRYSSGGSDNSLGRPSWRWSILDEGENNKTQDVQLEIEDIESFGKDLVRKGEMLRNLKKQRRQEQRDRNRFSDFNCVNTSELEMMKQFSSI